MVSNWAKRSKFPGQRVTFTKPWRERRRSHPGRVRRPLEAAPRTGAFDLVREYALPIPLTVIVRDSQTTAVNDAKSAARRQATRVASAHSEVAARTRSGVSVVFWREIHAFADANGNGRCETDDDACWASELFPPWRDMATARLGVRFCGRRVALRAAGPLRAPLA